MWKSSDVNETQQYRLHLCQTSDGMRSIKLVLLGSDTEAYPPNDVFLITTVVPNDLLKSRNVIRIADTVVLTDGRRFYVDAHGIWLADSEWQEMNSSLSFKDVHWITGTMPNFPPR